MNLKIPPNTTIDYFKTSPLKYLWQYVFTTIKIQQ